MSFPMMGKVCPCCGKTMTLEVGHEEVPVRDVEQD